MDAAQGSTGARGSLAEKDPCGRVRSPIPLEINLKASESRRGELEMAKRKSGVRELKEVLDTQ